MKCTVSIQFVFPILSRIVHSRPIAELPIQAHNIANILIVCFLTFLLGDLTIQRAVV